MKTKKCGTCGNTYPKTLSYFFAKKQKQYNSKGELKIYNGFRSDCKKCHGLKGGELRLKKRCKELKCEIKDYQLAWRKQQSKSSTVDVEAKNKLTKGQYNYFTKLLRQGNNITYDDYLLRIEENRIKNKERIRAVVYSRQKYFSKEDLRLAQRMYAGDNVKRLTDCYIANVVMKCKISDLTPEIIETKRNIIQLKRELKSWKQKEI